MRLIEFCPGEGSRFLVGASVLTLADAHPLGGTDETVLVLFGLEREMRAHPFECNPRKRDTLARSYVAEKFPRMDEATLTAAHHVIAHLIGRDAFGARYSPESLDWEPGWRAMLLPLVEEIASGLLRGASAEGIAAYQPVLSSTRKADEAVTALAAETRRVFSGIPVFVSAVVSDAPESEVPLG